MNTLNKTLAKAKYYKRMRCPYKLPDETEEEYFVRTLKHGQDFNKQITLKRIGDSK